MKRLHWNVFIFFTEHVYLHKQYYLYHVHLFPTEEGRILWNKRGILRTSPYIDRLKMGTKNCALIHREILYWNNQFYKCFLGPTTSRLKGYSTHCAILSSPDRTGDCCPFTQTTDEKSKRNCGGFDGFLIWIW